MLSTFSRKAITVLRKLFTTLLLLLLVLVAVYSAIHIRAVEQLQQQWQHSQVEPLPELGSSKSLRITPLVNWHRDNNSLKTEAGVSYLIETDQQRLLFDVGFNQKSEVVTPIQHNMKQLGLELNSIDTVFISHNHLDHSGGQSWVSQNTFSLGQQQTALGNTRIFAIPPVQYPSSKVTQVNEAMPIGEGLASIGPIKRRLFMGEIEEQALAVHLEGKGMVLVVGCGHQTLEKILQRYDQLFEQPLYGIVGDLHYPYPSGRLTLLGINLQRYLASGTGPWNPISEADIRRDMALLADRNLKLIALGGHDTSDEVIGWFKQQFGNRYQHVKVGKVIEVQ